MIKVLNIAAAACLVLAWMGPAQAQQGGTDPTRSKSLEEEERFHNRIQRSNQRAMSMICAEGCRGAIRGKTQPKDPFALLPHFHDDPAPDLPGQEP